MDFPQITVADQAKAHKVLLDALGITELHAIIGSSVGGMNALQVAADCPDLAKKLAVFCATAQTSPVGS